MPYLRLLAKRVADMIASRINRDNVDIHDAIGSQSDPYTHFVMTNESVHNCCHCNLTRGFLPLGLIQRDVHDVFNAFMWTGFMRHTRQYFSKPRTEVKGDFLKMFAHLDLLASFESKGLQITVGITILFDRADVCKESTHRAVAIAPRT